MTDFDLPPEAVEAGCRATHPVRWEYPATAHPCDDCTTAVTAAGPIIAAEARERAAEEIEREAGRRDPVSTVAVGLRRAARIARGTRGPYGVRRRDWVRGHFVETPNPYRAEETNRG